MMTTKTTLTTTAALVLALAGHAAATAQSSGLSKYERPYGFGYGQEDRPVDGYGLRDRNGNLTITNGLIQGGSGLGYGLNTEWGQTDGFFGATGFGNANTGTAIGNQLNVITQGNYNMVIIDSTQINNGDQTAVLNGELDLND
jgi:holdfast attachment protein HfaA